MVEVGEGTEELGGAALTVANDHATLAGAFHLEDLDDRPVTLLDVPHYLRTYQYRK